MGWNDRLPEDPYIPYESQDDRDAYENWAMYLEMLQAEAGGLSSNNVQPGDLANPGVSDDSRDRLRELFEEVTARKTCAPPVAEQDAKNE